MSDTQLLLLPGVTYSQLLEEMLDNGFPLATELNVLKEMIRPPSMLRSAVDSVTGGSHVASTLPTGQLSNVPWRRVGVKYANNEVSGIQCTPVYSSFLCQLEVYHSSPACRQQALAATRNYPKNGIILGFWPIRSSSNVLQLVQVQIVCCWGLWKLV